MEIGPTMVLIIIIVFLDSLGTSLMIPILPFYAKELGGNLSDQGIILSIYGLLQLIGAPIIGKISDRFGRKPAYILSLISSLLSYITINYAETFLQLILTRIPVSLFKHNEASAVAMVCDLYKGNTKTVYIGYIGSAIGLGFILGPFITALLLENSYLNPTLLSSSIFVINLILVILFLTETKYIKSNSNDESKFDEPSSNRKCDILFNNELRIYYFILFCLSISAILFNSNYATLLEKIDVDIKEVGFIMSYSGLLSVIGGLVIKLLARFNKKIVFYISLYILVASQIFTPLITSSYQLMLIMIPFTLSNKILRHLNISLLTSKSPPKNTGEALSVVNSLDSISRTIIPLLGGILINYIHIAAPFHFSSFICTMALITLFMQSDSIFNFE